MITKPHSLGVLLALLSLASVSKTPAQGTFQNLNFESATIVPLVVGGVPHAEFIPAFPGWTGFIGSQSPLFATFNNPALGTTAIGLVNQVTGFGGPINNYTAFLQGGSGDNFPDVSLAQTGLVPAGTLSLRFLGQSAFGSRPFMVSLGGQSLTPIVLQDFGTYKEYGADISGFAGQTAELRFTQGHGLANQGNFFLDEISFSTIPVPEPGTWALLGLGGALLWCGGRRSRR